MLSVKKEIEAGASKVIQSREDIEGLVPLEMYWFAQNER